MLQTHLLVQGYSIVINGSEELVREINTCLRPRVWWHFIDLFFYSANTTGNDFISYVSNSGGDIRKVQCSINTQTCGKMYRAPGVTQWLISGLFTHVLVWIFWARLSDYVNQIPIGYFRLSGTGLDLIKCVILP